jgi:hypothetical protein
MPAEPAVNRAVWHPALATSGLAAGAGAVTQTANS